MSNYTSASAVTNLVALTKSQSALLLLVATTFIVLQGCSSSLSTSNSADASTEYRAPVTANLAASASAPQGVSIDYLCPDLFEGHIFSCPTIPSLGFALDMNTDAIGGSLELTCSQAHGGICVSPAIEYSRGSESYGGGDIDLFEKAAGIDVSTDYSVIQLRMQGKYAFSVSADSSTTISPIVGPRLYRWSAIDCPFDAGCTETLLVLDVGVGVQYKNFGIDATTGLNGPNFAARLKYYFGR